ncbi:hypothetical protein [Halorubrum sp. SD626R]|uniref:hypothetical protein n=1 Tax=Halorubrum sp. SD626R TaxID=1419722 RepID=UPI000A7764EA|nr:hypothetical protein [Halorubrum sp. SD626R]TKX80181.1 hypothetical protein EXE53_12330 [Halorubrum sp. SD626R]
MTTRLQNWLLGLTVVALLAAPAGDLLEAERLVRVAVPTFFLAAASLFTVMTVTKLVDAIRSSGPDMHDPARTE